MLDDHGPELNALSLRYTIGVDRAGNVCSGQAKHIDATWRNKQGHRHPRAPAQQRVARPKKLNIVIVWEGAE